MSYKPNQIVKSKEEVNKEYTQYLEVKKRNDNEQ